MIVDDIEKHHQAVTVRGIDERAQIVGPAVAASGAKAANAVVTPVVAAGKFRDRHQLDGGDTERGKARQFAGNTGKAAEHAGVRFVEHRLVPRPPAPVRMAPAIGQWIDHDAGAVHVAVLGARGGIGNDGAVRQNVAITRASSAVRFGLEPAVSRRRHRHAAQAFDLDRHRRLAGSPQAKARVARIDQRGAERQVAGEGRHAAGPSGCSVSTTLRARTRYSRLSSSVRSGASGSALSSRSSVVPLSGGGAVNSPVSSGRRG